MLKMLLALIFVGNAVLTSANQGNTYILYTKDTHRTPVEIEIADIDTSTIDPADKTVILVHGHGGDASSSFNSLIVNELLTEETNVIVVDWSGSSKLSYANAVLALQTVGAELAAFIDALVLDKSVVLADIHLVGFNLGAHAVGIAGRNVNGVVGRITGLDPSRNQWGANSPRLSVNDALYVEVIHTDGNSIFGNGIGTAIGNVDFFVNGGGNQPGCIVHSCCHNRAYEVFAASLNTDHLVGNLCSTDLQLSLNRCRGQELVMGGRQLNKLGSGIYRVNTGRSYPY